MRRIGIYQAKTAFSRLVKEVRAGNEVIILDRGVPVAKLIALDAPPASDNVQAFRALRAQAKRVTRAEARAWVTLGRK